MTHTVREKQKLLARVRRMKGQVAAIERALEDEAGCERVMHLVDGRQHPGALNTEAAEQLMDIVRSYLK